MEDRYTSKEAIQDEIVEWENTLISAEDEVAAIKKRLKTLRKALKVLEDG